MTAPMTSREALEKLIQRHASAYVARGSAISDDIIAECKASREALFAALRAGVAQTPPIHVSWTDADYNKARDCMIGLLRGHGWTIVHGRRDQQEFDNAFQHAVGILALTASLVSRPHRGEGTV